MEDLSLVTGEAIQFHCYLQARHRLMVGLVVFIYVAELEASWLMGIGAVMTAG